MKRTIVAFGTLVVAGLAITACSDDDNKKSEKQLVVENYANIVYQNYADALADAEELKTAINAFTASPSATGLDTAKQKWKDARESYGPTEAFRFANGPIDDEENGPEGLLNAWPLDENYIDYVDNDGTVQYGGIINDVATYPTITKELLEDLNEDGGEKNISVGYHAIEFLLWGQDLTDPSVKLPGLREYTDYTTAPNFARRKQYLDICADLLIDHLTYLVDLWKPGGSYRSTFLGLNEDTALTNIYLGIATLVTSELPVERMAVALDNHDQEDEHSCFSDNTHRDIALNLQGIINVYHGEYGNISGPSLADLVQKANSNFYTSTEAAITAANTKVAAMAIPFDYAISGGEGSAEGAKVKLAYESLRDNLGPNLIAGSVALGLRVNP
nr:imelysin family protein [uncultured Flavobacterium sp.]